MKPYRKTNIANMIAESCETLPIKGTPYKLAVSHHLGVFTIGHIEFKVYDKYIEASEPLPASWCVNLNA